MCWRSTTIQLLSPGRLPMKRVAIWGLVGTCVIAATSPTRAHIYQWEYINPADPSQGKRQSTTLTPGGAGVDAVPGADLSNRNLTMAYLSGANLTKANANQTDLSNADLSHANLKNVNFGFTWFSDADLSGSEIQGASFFGCCYLVQPGIRLDQLYSTASYQAHDLSGIRLLAHGLVGANFVGQNLNGANFQASYLDDADF